MKTRVGKIARLPHHIREQLNQRLFNGALGPELMKWLNTLPEVESVLTKFFDGSPINRQNLTEWRQGGYEDWLRYQDRERRIQRITEEGGSLQDHEGGQDLFENAARIAIAELMVDLDSLDQMDRDKRWSRLRELTRELARLQNGFNRSRWAELAWTKWTERFLGPNDYAKEQEETPDTEVISRSAELNSAVSPNCIRQSVTIAETSEPPPPTPISDLPTPRKTPECKPNQTTSTGGEIENGSPVSSRLFPDGRVALPRDSIIRHAPSRDENPTPPPTAPPIRPLSPISPIKNQPAITPFDPLADFRRKTAHLKTLREGAPSTS